MKQNKLWLQIDFVLILWKKEKLFNEMMPVNKNQEMEIIASRFGGEVISQMISDLMIFLEWFLRRV
jgi:hypothetical protein